VSSPLHRWWSHLSRGLVTLPKLQAATAHVSREFRRLGLLTQAVHDCTVELVPFGQSLGWAYSDGEIQIPAVSLGRVFSRKRETAWLRPLLRHEYAHCLASVHPELVEGWSFRHAFGAGYDHEWKQRPRFDPAKHVSRYCSEAPAEDFAEVTEVFVRRQGEVEDLGKTEWLRRRFDFVAGLSNRIKREGIPLA
jgi:hypothetical protein